MKKISESELRKQLTRHLPAPERLLFRREKACLPACFFVHQMTTLATAYRLTDKAGWIEWLFLRLHIKYQWPETVGVPNMECANRMRAQVSYARVRRALKKYHKEHTA